MNCQNTGQFFTPGCDANHNRDNDDTTKYTPYDFFMACFPADQLSAMVDLTSVALRQAGHPPTTTGEVLKWLGITVLITRFQFADRASLWSCDSTSKYVPSPNIGTKTGMARARYDSLLQNMVWSFQPKVREEGMSSETHRWMLVGDFVDRINNHRKNFYSPSSVICVDESISRWYGIGGHWINKGLPMYVAIDRKPEDGCEIQNACDGVSGIMMQLKLVKTQAHQTAEEEETAAAHAAALAGAANARDLAAQEEDVDGYVACLCVCILFSILTTTLF